MKKTFVISDTHFGHKGVCQFLREDGVTKLRPWTDPDIMDQDMIDNWNSVVSPTDKVYHLGDVVINRRALKVLGQLNGDKVLIKGNHDIFQLKDYVPYFRDIRGYHVLNGMIFSHIPVHPDNLYRFGCNIHGHLHDKRIKNIDGSINPNYFNVSVEQIDFTPIQLDDLVERIKLQGGTIGFKNGNGPIM